MQNAMALTSPFTGVETAVERLLCPASTLAVLSVHFNTAPHFLSGALLGQARLFPDRSSQRMDQPHLELPLDLHHTWRALQHLDLHHTSLDPRRVQCTRPDLQHLDLHRTALDLYWSERRQILATNRLAEVVVVEAHLDLVEVAVVQARLDIVQARWDLVDIESVEARLDLGEVDIVRARLDLAEVDSVQAWLDRLDLLEVESVQVGLALVEVGSVEARSGPLERLDRLEVDSVQVCLDPVEVGSVEARLDRLDLVEPGSVEEGSQLSRNFRVSDRTSLVVTRVRSIVAFGTSIRGLAFGLHRWLLL